MVSVIALSAVDRGWSPDWVKPKTKEISICCFSAKQAAVRRKKKRLAG